MAVHISRQHFDQLLDFAKLAEPNECCGLLFGENGRIVDVKTAENVATNPASHFEIDPAALIAAEKEQRAGGMAILGYFHSHPGGTCNPSQTDADAAAKDGRYWLIIANNDIKAWRAAAPGGNHPHFDAVLLQRGA